MSWGLPQAAHSTAHFGDAPCCCTRHPGATTTTFLGRTAPRGVAALAGRVAALRADFGLFSEPRQAAQAHPPAAVLSSSELQGTVAQVQRNLAPGTAPTPYHYRQSQVSREQWDQPDQRADGAEESESLPRPAGGDLRLKSAVAYLPHPDKAHTGGEDAHFIAAGGLAVGVSDGVGAWADEQVDAGQYARALMHAAEHYAGRIMPCQEAPQGIMHLAHQQVFVKGSATALIVVLERNRLHSANLGDSCLLVVRDGDVRFRAPIQQRGFNCPFQLASPRLPGYTRPRQAAVRTVEVAPGDIVVAGTDGLWDNLFMRDCAMFLHDRQRKGDGPEELATGLAARARTRAQDPYTPTPFALRAQDHNIPFSGGKMDDITVVCSVVTEKSSL